MPVNIEHRRPAAPARRYFDYINFNATGYRPYVTTLYAVLLGCLRKALSRMLVLIVAMGFGVVLPYLGAVQKKARRCCASPYLRAAACISRLQHRASWPAYGSACTISSVCSSVSVQIIYAIHVSAAETPCERTDA